MSGGNLVKADIGATADYKKLVEEKVSDKSYLNICDFDDHFENVENDWTNKHF